MRTPAHRSSEERRDESHHEVKCTTSVTGSTVQYLKLNSWLYRAGQTALGNGFDLKTCLKRTMSSTPGLKFDCCRTDEGSRYPVAEGHSHFHYFGGKYCILLKYRCVAHNMNKNIFSHLSSVLLPLPVTKNCRVLYCPFCEMKSSVPRDKPRGSSRDNCHALRQGNTFSRGLQDTHEKIGMDQHRQWVLHFPIHISAWKQAGNSPGFWGVIFKANYYLVHMIKSDL